MWGEWVELTWGVRTEKEGRGRHREWCRKGKLNGLDRRHLTCALATCS